MTKFDVSVFENVKLATVVPLGNSLNRIFNLVIFFTEPGDINWDVVKDLIKEPDKDVSSKSISTSPWSYRCCDYTLGLLLSLVEMVTRKEFKEMPQTEENAGVEYVRYFELI